jgi:hydroxylamine reductase (hybrid-cluster protein)
VAQEALDLASRRHLKKSYLTPSLLRPTPQKVLSPIYDRGKEIQASLAAGHNQGILVILGETNVKQTFFERTLSLMEYGLNQNLIVLVGGELAAQADLLNEELAKRSGGKLPTPSLSYLGSLLEIPKLVAFLQDLDSGKSFDRIPAVITFPEFFRTSTWATAVSFLSLGFAVQIGTRLPFWGSPPLVQVLLKEWPQISGGTLLASPSLPDIQTQAQEIATFLKDRNSRR